MIIHDKKIIGSILLMLTVLTWNCKSDKKQHQQKNPNIVIIFVDDEGYGDVGSYGATGFETPNIDVMVSNGMKFTNYYAAQPVCTTSRAGILTGCYPNRIGFYSALFPKDTIGLNKSEITIPELLKKEGYATACFGKWHLGWQEEFLPLQHGFDEFIGLPYSNDMWPYDNVTGEKLAKGRYRSDFPELTLIQGNKAIDTINTFKDQDNLTTLYTEKAVDFINRHAETPFFLYVPHSMGHVPLGVSDKFKGKSGSGLYGDVMMEIDWSVGEIMKTLKYNNLEENTIVIFTSDNGPWLNYGNHAGSAGGLREGKLTSWEGGQRVPFIIQWPGNIPKGTVCNKLASAIDLLPTFAKITKSELPENNIDGVDISSLWLGDFESNPRETILYYLGKNNLNAVRKGDWKLVLPHDWRSYASDPGINGHKGKMVTMNIESPELYNMMRDPGERYNVINQHPDIVKELMVEVKSAREKFGDLNIGIENGSETREIGHLSEVL